jgi:hypothetical protein
VQQDILERRPDTNLAIYAVWFNMYPGDARVKWPAELLTDRRVSHYWDERRLVGVRLLLNLPGLLDRQAPGTLPPDADALWDTFLVYAPRDQWNEPFPRPVSWGYPIMVTKDQLARDVDRFAAK